MQVEPWPWIGDIKRHLYRNPSSEPWQKMKLSGAVGKHSLRQQAAAPGHMVEPAIYLRNERHNQKDQEKIDTIFRPHGAV